MTIRNYPPYPSGSLLLARLFCYTVFGACCFVIGHWAGDVTASKNCTQIFASSSYKVADAMLKAREA